MKIWLYKISLVLSVLVAFMTQTSVLASGTGNCTGANLTKTFTTMSSGSTYIDDTFGQYTLIQDGQQNKSVQRWAKEQIDLNYSFSINFRIRFTDGGNAGEGMTFALHRSSEGLKAKGGSGTNMGIRGVTPTVFIEFDTRNSGGDDIGKDHSAGYYTASNGNLLNFISPKQMDGNGDLKDGDYHLIDMKWNHSNKQLSFSIDGAYGQSGTIDLIDKLGGNGVYWGFTAGTGGSGSSDGDHEICIENASWINYTPYIPPDIDHPTCNVVTNPEVFYTNVSNSDIKLGLLELTKNNELFTSRYAWAKNKLNLTKDFHMTFRIYLGNSGSTGGDGIAFALHNSSAGKNAIGSNGGELGVKDNITPAFAVAFDSNENIGSTRKDAIYLYSKNNQGTTDKNNLQQLGLNGNWRDGNYHKVDIDWKASTKTLEVQLNNDNTIAKKVHTFSNVDLASILGSSRVYWGFTAGTGGASNSQKICVEGNDWFKYVSRELRKI